MVRVSTAASETAGGLILTPESSKRPKVGVIVAVPENPRYTTEDRYEVGDHVMWSNEYVAEVVQDGDDRVVSLKSANIAARW